MTDAEALRRIATTKVAEALGVGVDEVSGTERLTSLERAWLATELAPVVGATVDETLRAVSAESVDAICANLDRLARP
ncbi:hypothetical protein [Saccharothrix texasensis]|uniref:Uncharacterized protein n=1 Tax=Saccharothrix texasensis TaxID=103734 RepID=A0A3N1GXF3_9PSEU|nr:hypothetical protein [Saccharothrix texasensis]ROP34940.1 hypothetical protein EDD40_0149 [Saccharothrix texasensis]